MTKVDSTKPTSLHFLRKKCVMTTVEFYTSYRAPLTSGVEDAASSTDSFSIVISTEKEDRDFESVQTARRRRKRKRQRHTALARLQ